MKVMAIGDRGKEDDDKMMAEAPSKAIAEGAGRSGD